MVVTRKELVRDFQRLGLKRGDAVLVHSALSAIGNVRGGADAVIDALLEVLGREGTLLMPALTGKLFDVRNSPTYTGLIPEVFRQRKGVLRSFHPTHSVTALGARAEELTAGHLECPTACGKGTPYVKLMDTGGKILLIGVDQDRNTSLHTLEDLVNAPYLSAYTAKYLDPKSGKTKTLTMQRFPGPHRDFIGLDHLFRAAGVMQISKAGRAVCRLIDAGGMRDVGLRALRADPAAVLCNNPNCADCVTQRAKIKRPRLSLEDFQLSVVSDVAGHCLEEMFAALGREGLRHIELRQINGREIASFTDQELKAVRAKLRAAEIKVTAVSALLRKVDWSRLIDAAGRLGATAVVMPLDAYQPELGKRAAQQRIALRLENTRESSAQCAERLESIREKNVSLAFNPGYFAVAGEKPFLRIYARGPLKRCLTQLYVNDATFAGESTLPGQGNAEIKELISILRCSSFDGPMTLKPDGKLYSFTAQLGAFWKLIDTM